MTNNTAGHQRMSKHLEATMNESAFTYTTTFSNSNPRHSRRFWDDSSCLLVDRLSDDLAAFNYFMGVGLDFLFTCGNNDWI